MMKYWGCVLNLIDWILLIFSDDGFAYALEEEEEPVPMKRLKKVCGIVLLISCNNLVEWGSQLWAEYCILRY